MKMFFYFAVLLSLASCSSNEVKFDYEKHCAPEALKQIDGELSIVSLNKKKKRGAITKKELEKLNLYTALGRDFNNILQPQFFECVAEYEMAGYRGSFAVCSVVVTDQKGKISFLSVDDAYNKLNPGLKSCLTKSLQSFNFSKYPGITITQPINVNP